MGLYSIQYSLLEIDGTTPAPTWIKFDVSGIILIDHLLTTTAGSYTFMLKGEVFYNLATTNKYKTKNFTVVLYKLTAVAAVDQIYPI